MRHVTRPVSKYEQPAGTGAAWTAVVGTTRLATVAAVASVMNLASEVGFMPSLSRLSDHLPMSKRAHVFELLIRERLPGGVKSAEAIGGSSQGFPNLIN